MVMEDECREEDFRIDGFLYYAGFFSCYKCRCGFGFAAAMCLRDIHILLILPRPPVGYL